MIAFISFVLAVLASPFKSKSRLEAENAVLRHRLIVLRRRVRGRTQPTNIDRWFLVQMYRWFPPILKVVTIVQPETLVRFARRPKPKHPQDLTAHDCINMRLPTYGGIYAWEFEKRGRALKVRVEGQLVFNNIALRVNAALAGLGLAYLSEDQVHGHVTEGRLVRGPRRLVPAIFRLAPLLSKPHAAPGFALAGRSVALPQFKSLTTAAQSGRSYANSIP
jgi:hypothetical protein